MKKTIILRLVLALVLLLLAVGLAFLPRLISSFVPKAETGYRPDDVEAYLTEKWSFYRLRSWDEAAGALVLEYPQQLTYEQFEKYGETLDFDADALAQTDRMREVCVGIAARLQKQVRSITVIGVSSDGKEVYTVDQDGKLTACWHNTKIP